MTTSSTRSPSILNKCQPFLVPTSPFLLLYKQPRNDDHKPTIIKSYNHRSSSSIAEQQQSQQPAQQPRSHHVVKAATAVSVGGSLLVLSGLTLAGTVILLSIATPLLVIFSPVLVPAVTTVSLLIMGFLASGGFGVAAVTVMSWIYRYVTGRHPPGADQLEQATMKLSGKAREMKERSEQFGQQIQQTS